MPASQESTQKPLPAQDRVPAGRFGRIRAPAAYQLVARQIEELILTGGLVPGDEVGTEAELSRQFGVNRSTVREGIRLLEQSGMVSRSAGRRLCVSAPRLRSLGSRMGRALVLGSVTFHEVYQASLLLETETARAAARNAGALDLAALEDNLAESIAISADAARLAALDAEFHRLIARAAGNRVLEMARAPAASLFFPTTTMICEAVPEGTGRLLEAHRHLIDAMARHDEAAAALWMHRHVVDWLKGFIRTGRNPKAVVELEPGIWAEELE